MTSREIRLPARYALVVEAAIDRVVRVVRDLARQESERPGGEEVVIRLSIERGRAARRTA